MDLDAQHNKQRSVKKVAVVGAGVSGLAAAYKLKLQGLKVTVFEADGRAGGKIRSVFQDGLIWDEGANTMMESDIEVRKLLDSLELRWQQQIPVKQNNRYIVKNGVPELVPSNPIALIKSNLLSTQSKLQIILEPFLWKRSNISKTSIDEEESVAEFFQRHFGKEVVDYLIDPIVAGSSSGDPEHISMRHAFPEIWQIEKRFGSIILGAIKSRLSAKREKGETVGSSSRQKHQRSPFSFYGGMQTLTDALCKELGRDELKLKSEVLSLSYSFDGKSTSKNWSVSSSHRKYSQDMPFDAVIMTAPLGNVKKMKISKGGMLFPINFIPEVEYMPLSVIITTFKKENVKRSLEGFGVLVPCKEQQTGLKSLGTLFSSMMFPDRAPSDLYMYTTFIGGSRNRELAKASMDELRQIVSSDLQQLLGAEGEPTFVNHCYWSKAFPLYGRNYSSVMDSIKRLEENLPGFFYAGNHKGGLSVGKAIASGCKAADLVVSYLDSSSDEKVLKEVPSL